MPHQDPHPARAAPAQAAPAPPPEADDYGSAPSSDGASGDGAALVYAFGPFVLDPVERRLTCDGAPVEAAPKALDLLVLLARAGGRLLTREELTEALWPDAVVEENGLNVVVAKARGALGENARSWRYVETVARRGYRLAGAVAVGARVGESERTPRGMPEGLVSERAVAVSVAGGDALPLPAHRLAREAPPRPVRRAWSRRGLLVAGAALALSAPAALVAVFAGGERDEPPALRATVEYVPPPGTTPDLGRPVTPSFAPTMISLDIDEATLARYWFDDAHPDTIFDVSGHGLHALNEGSTSVPGRYNGARAFDGIDDRIDLDAARMALQGTTEWTIELIARSADGGGPLPFVALNTCANGWRIAADGPTLRYGIKTTASGPPGNRLCHWGPDRRLTIPDVGTDWHYVALAFAGDAVRIHLDGVLLERRRTAGTFLDKSLGLGRHAWIGYDDSWDPGEGGYSTGLVDELRVSAVARSPEEICWTADALGWACTPPSTGAGAGPMGDPAHGVPEPDQQRVHAGMVRYTIPEQANVSLMVYDALGREVAVLIDGLLLPGEYRATLDARAFPPGTYVLHLEAGRETVVRPFTVAR